MHPNDFSRERLQQMLQLSRSRGYRSVLFGEEDENGPYILWRHDVDVELRAAVEMAELETLVGIRSTYFLMVSSWFYNLFSAEGERTIERLLSLRHAVGLHCDLRAPRSANLSAAEVEEKVATQFAIAEASYGTTFRRVVSFHNPPAAVINRDFSTFYSAYQTKFFSSIKYLSDSNRRWRDGPPEESFVTDTYPRISILLHPVIWAYPGSTMPEGMRHFIAHRQKETEAMLIEDDIDV